MLAVNALDAFDLAHGQARCAVAVVGLLGDVGHKVVVKVAQALGVQQARDAPDLGVD